MLAHLKRMGLSCGHNYYFQSCWCSFVLKSILATASSPWYSLPGIAVANQTLLITQGKWFILSSWIINSAAVPISGEINVGKPLLCCTVCNLHCKVSMDGSPTDVNAVNLHFVENWFYALSCPMVHANHRWPSPSKFQKPLKNHWNQWLDPPKTFNGDGPMVVKPLKNHRSQWWPEKKH